MKIFTFCLAFVGIICAGISGGLIINYVIKWYRKRKLSNVGLNSSNENPDNYFRWFMRNGVSILKRPSKFLLSHSKFLNNNFENLTLLLNERNVKCDSVSVSSSILAFLVFSGFISSLLCGSIVVGLALILCFSILLVTFTRASIDRQITNLRNSIPDTLRSMSTCFGAGYTIFQTFSHISIESKGSIKSLFSKCTNIFQTI